VYEADFCGGGDERVEFNVKFIHGGYSYTQPFYSRGGVCADGFYGYFGAVEWKIMHSDNLYPVPCFSEVLSSCFVVVTISKCGQYFHLQLWCRGSPFETPE